MRILIAEDDRATALMMASLIRSWGYEIAIAHDGKTALDLFERETGPQLVVLDWVLPDMNGPDVCGRIRDLGPSRFSYIILSTSKNARTDVIAGLDAGADEYLIKPVDPNELRARLNAGVRIINLQQHLADKIRELEEAAASVRTLSGLLPICAYCKSIRDDSNYWHRVEEFVSEHADVQFSHGICPKCFTKAAGEMAVEDERDV